LLEPLVDLLEPLVDLLEPLVDLLEPLVDLLEPLMHLCELVAHLFESSAHTQSEIGQLIQQPSELISPRKLLRQNPLDGCRNLRVLSQQIG
jgi:hypothetical protein